MSSSRAKGLKEEYRLRVVVKGVVGRCGRRL